MDALFPSTGRSARVLAVLRDGRRVRVGARLSLKRIRYFHVMSDDGGYIVKPRTRPAGAAAHLMSTRPQASAPRPGPTLAIQLARAARFDTAGLLVRIVPVRGAAQAAALERRWSGTP